MSFSEELHLKITHFHFIFKKKIEVLKTIWKSKTEKYNDHHEMSVDIHKQVMPNIFKQLKYHVHNKSFLERCLPNGMTIREMVAIF